MSRVMALMLGLMAVAPAAFAEESAPTEPSPSPTSEDGRVSYDPGFFDQFAPQNALDMVSRVPGFSIDQGDDRRGFSGTGGNVLINGERPSSKSQGLRDILSRIPARAVERIELIRGGSGSDAAGQGVVVNVVRRESGGEGLYEVELEHSEDGRLTPRGELSYSGRVGEASYTLGLNRFMENRPLAGLRWLGGPSGALTGTRYDYSPRTFRETEFTASLESPLLGGTLRLNAEGGRWRFAANTESAGFNAAGVFQDEFSFPLEDRERGRELGGDFERAFGPITLKLVGLDRRYWFASDVATIERDAARRFTERSDQSTRQLQVERIGRVTLTASPLDSLNIEAGYEQAYNSLDQVLRLTVDDGTGPRAVLLPSASVLVEEDRSEAFARAVWTPSPLWTFEAALNVENSVLTQSGDAAQSTELTYWKPSLQASRRIGERNQVRLRAWRDVGQLDFGDFVSATEFNDDRVAAGNPDLRPQAEWRLDATVELRWGERGAFTFEASRRFIEDAVDQIPVAGFDAPGNIGDADALLLEFETEIPIDWLLAGGIVEMEGGWADTEVTDPVTGRARTLSGWSDHWWELGVRQDVPGGNLAWGVSAFAQTELENFRLTERETYEEKPWVSAYVETTAFEGVKVRLWAENITNRTFRRDRRFFTPDRAGAFTRSETRERTFGPFFGVTVSGSF